MESIEPIYKQFGARLHAARSKAQLTQAELANRVGVQRTTITNIEAGNQRLSLHLVYDLAKVLGVSYSELLPPQHVERSPQELAPRLKKTLSGQQEGVEDWVVRLIRDDHGDDEGKS